MAFKLSLVLICVIFLTGCLPSFKDSPYSDSVRTSARGINTTHIENLQQSLKSRTSLKIGLLADNHQNYKDLDESIAELNRRPDLDFIVVLGDFTNSSYNLEYDQYTKQILQLQTPVLTVLGNHDAIGAGITIYRKIFGDLNFVIELDHFKFIFFNSNNWETGSLFSIDWLESQTSGLSKKTYIFSHVGLDDTERFSTSELSRFSNIKSNPLVEIVLNGHKHVFISQNPAGQAQKLQVPRTEGNQGAEIWIEQLSAPRVFQRNGRNLREF